MKNLQIAGLVVFILLVGWLGVSYPVPQVIERVTETLGVNPGPDRYNPIECTNGACTAFYSGACTDATTSPISLANPFGATSTAIVRNLYGTNGTTSITLAIGTSTFVSAPLTTSPITDGPAGHYLRLLKQTIATSTGFSMAGSGENGSNPTASSTDWRQIVMGPSDRLLMVATGTTVGGALRAAQGLTNSNNEFTCNYSVEIYR